jgi:diguanylate cyclase (GGDEF)-like protein/excisionase family DNA binding protein
MTTPWFPEDVRQRVADTAQAHRDSLALDLEVLASAALPSLCSGDQRAQLAARLIDLFVRTLKNGLGTDNRMLADVTRAAETGLTLHDVFTLVRLAERCLESETAPDSQIGATSEHWPAVTESLRKASFDLLAEYCGRAGVRAATVEPTAALVSREMFEVALEKELQRAVRHHHPVSLILFDVDGIAEINDVHGRGVGDLVFERVGVFVRQFFRQVDWVGRYDSASVAVLLPETGGRHAAQLAEGARQAVHERLVFPDRDDHPVAVTVSGSIVSITVGRQFADPVAPFDARVVMAEAESAIRRARACGGNIIERVELARPSLSVTEAAGYLQCAPKTVRKLIATGMLPAIEAGGHMRVDRLALEAYGKRTGKRQR